MTNDIVTSGTQQERDVSTRPAGLLVSGAVGALVVVATVVAAVLMGIGATHTGLVGTIALCFACLATLVIAAVLCAGFVTIAPYQRVVVSLFGRYMGVERREGLGWILPFYSTRKVSTAMFNLESETIKVNDHSGNPISISSVIVYKVSDPAKMVYRVSNVATYVSQQVVAALRELAAKYDYDDIAPRRALEGTDNEDAAKTTAHTLRGNVVEMAGELKKMIQAQIGDVGVEIVEARIVKLSYSSEIAAAMLKKQQAIALLAARETIVEGAVGIVERAMEQMEKKGIKLDEDRRATIAGNLLVVIASERDATPVVPLGMS